MEGTLIATRADDVGTNGFAETRDCSKALTIERQRHP